MTKYDPQASLKAYEQIEAQRTPSDGVTELRVLTFLVVTGLFVVVSTALCLLWALQIP